MSGRCSSAQRLRRRERDTIGQRCSGSARAPDNGCGGTEERCLGLTGSCCRRSRHVVVLLILLRSLCRIVTVDVHRDHFSKETVGVIGQIVRISKDLLHTTCTLRYSVSFCSLLKKHVL